MKLNIYLSGLLLIIISNTCIGQRAAARAKTVPVKLFRFGAMIGPVLSQMDGDYYSGYDKLGLFGGIKGEVQLSKKVFLEIDLGYSSLGSKFPSLDKLGSITGVKRTVDIKYAEVPFIINFQFPKKTYDINFELGFGLMRMLDYKVTEDEASRKITSFTNTAESYKSQIFSNIIGLEYSKKGYGLAIRAVNAMNKHYYNQEFYDLLAKGRDVRNKIPYLRNYYISCIASYNFLATGGR